MAKAVLGAVAREEGQNLTALVARLAARRAATRDYLQSLVDVDALRRTGKRYFFVDPVLRAWARLHAQGPLPPAGRVAAIAAEMLAGAEPDPDPTPGTAPLESAITEPQPEPVRLRRPSDPLMEID